MQYPNPRIHSLIRAAFLLPALCLGATLALAQVEDNAAPDLRPPAPSVARVIVKFRPGAAILRKHALTPAATAAEASATVSARTHELGARVAIDLRPGRAISEDTQAVVASGVTSAELALRLAAQADIEYAVVDQRRTHFAVPNDPYYAHGPALSGTNGGPAVGQWYLRAPAGDVVSGINASGAWDLTTGSPTIVVAVLDTGVRPDHPDLAGRLLPGYDMVSQAAEGNDGNARDADAADPGDWVTDAESAARAGPFEQCRVEDSSWHGTKTASLVGAAANDGIGMAGVAWGVWLVPVRVLGKCGGLDSDILAGMRWAAGLSVPGLPVNFNPARVINMSLGASGGCQPSYRDTINAIAAKPNAPVIVAAAGNSVGQEVNSPANCAGVLAVAALRHAGTKVGFSDIGPEIAISAPGGNCVNTGTGVPCMYPILAATNTGLTTPAASAYSGSFSPSVGTSFSSPLVAGTVALMLSANPSLTPAQVKAALQASARPFPPRGASTVPFCRAPDGTAQLECFCTTSTCGAGMLDAAAAVAAVMPVVNVIEFHNAGLDNYFVTANAVEAAAIDGGSAGPGWARTGNTFKSGGSTPVCRFYGSLTPGPNSHFYTVDPLECASLKEVQAATPVTQKRWNFEILDFMSSAPVGGACANGAAPVYRAYNNGFARGIDSNHRLTRNAAAIQEVVNRGWIAEGVVMCAPD